MAPPAIRSPVTCPRRCARSASGWLISIDSVAESLRLLDPIVRVFGAYGAAVVVDYRTSAESAARVVTYIICHRDTA